MRDGDERRLRCRIRRAVPWVVVERTIADLFRASRCPAACERGPFPLGVARHSHSHKPRTDRAGRQGLRRSKAIRRPARRVTLREPLDLRLKVRAPNSSAGAQREWGLLFISGHAGWSPMILADWTRRAGWGVTAWRDGNVRLRGGKSRSGSHPWLWEPLFAPCASYLERAEVAEGEIAPG
jgi:hypothetical protein